jgi:acetyltransferase-like isoleucine patch superfamily enzyme
MKRQLIDLLKQNQTLLFITAWFFNLFNLSHKIILRKNTFVYKGSFIKNIRYRIKGQNNIIIIHPETRLRNCLFYINGNNCKIEVGKHCILANTQFWIEDDLGSISIGCNTTFEEVHIAATEGNSISIGNDCMLSSNIQIRNGDSHTILDLNSQQRINKGKNITIGDHVWLGEGVKILKGAQIKSNSIIGTGSILSNLVVENNCIYAGIPAKKIKENITWKRER